jgi:hypothetical protein
MKPATQTTLTTAGAIELANHLILEFLKAGPRSATEILAAAEGAKISVRTVQRAAIDLGVVKTKAGFAGGWIWTLPTEDAKAESGFQEQAAAEASVNSPKVSPRVEAENEKVLGRVERANVIAARLRKLEAMKGRKAPIFAADPRIVRWADAGLSDPDLKEAYEAATAFSDEPLTVGRMADYLDRLAA